MSVADRIDPLMGASSVEVAEPPRPAPKRKPRTPAQEASNGFADSPPPRRQPTPRKRAPVAARVEVEVVDEPVVSMPFVDSPTSELKVFDDLVVFDEPVIEKPAVQKPVVQKQVVKPPFIARPKKVAAPMAPAVVAEPVAEPAARDLDFFDNLDFEERVVDEKPAVQQSAEAWVEEQVEARQPYVLPKIIPAEPDPAPDEAPIEAPEALVVIEPSVEPVLEPLVADEAVTAGAAFKPKLLRVTKRLARSLQPVIVPRQRPRVRRVTRVVRHVDTWSVFKIALLFNIFLYAVCLTAGVMLWRVALNTGTIENIERFFESFGWQTFELKGGEIYHNAWIAGLFVIVGLTGIAVLAATMFNLITDLVGGVRLTVLEEEVVAREQRVTTWPRLLRPSPPPRREPPND